MTRNTRGSAWPWALAAFNGLAATLAHLSLAHSAQFTAVGLFQIGAMLAHFSVLAALLAVVPWLMDSLRRSARHLDDRRGADLRHAATDRRRQRDGLRAVQIPPELDGVVSAHAGRRHGDVVVLVADMVCGRRDRAGALCGSIRRAEVDRTLGSVAYRDPPVRDRPAVRWRGNAIHQRVCRRHRAAIAVDGRARDPMGATADGKIVPRAIRVCRNAQ